MRALLDYHHGDLLESSLILLEDRLGIECYVPSGFGWWENGYWQFGRSAWGDDRLARQFLTPANIRRDDSHPKREHRLIEFNDAFDLGWDFVVASLQDNYQGYAQFARETNAKLVIQVGNVNQAPGWQFDPFLILNSSSAPMQGQSVTYHQPFHLEDFAPTPITNPARITNMVNCVQVLPCYPLMQEFARLTADFEWCVHGIDGPDGNVKPTARVGELMQQAGWAWHDKVTGDGFGHVIHGWASVGRPLIGHASHYAGQMAGVFWEDGVTCIDLDRHSPEEAASIVRTVTGTYRQQEMADELHRRFALIDWDGEAEQVREALL